MGAQKPRRGLLALVPGFWFSNPLRMAGCSRSLGWNNKGSSRREVAGGSAKADENGLFAVAGAARPDGSLKPAVIPPTPTPVTGVDGFGARPLPKLIGSRPSARLLVPPGLVLKKFLLPAKLPPFFSCC